ncbi:NACHT, LRR and PYD domains-containing protein 3-like [Erpetoichthys calabaricus]|uniref:NACHT, LRR and PYD domains-containing protein 3-like n=1 Tax=Erpetoichthys calabaricus TaxID=27687 RepID=UPI0022349A9F|nr:NACHT, LRR and PYD domains-containing protein 3-like [Erpetoichthys calabaricus]
MQVKCLASKELQGCRPSLQSEYHTDGPMCLNCVQLLSASADLKKKFCKVIRTLPHEDLLTLTEYYKAELAYVMTYNITSILQNLATKHILTNDEAKRFKSKEKSEGGVEAFINDMMKKDRVLLSLWVGLAEELVRFPSPNLTRILEEVTQGGLELSKDIQDSLKAPLSEPHVKGLQDMHRTTLLESAKNLKAQPSLGVPLVMDDVIFETRYTELVVINQYGRTQIETQFELGKTGRTHAELVEERAKEKCEQIWTEQLFRRCPRNRTAPKIVVVSGMAGIGKSTMVQKIIFDWARGSQYRRFAFVFLFKFRDLNILEEKEPQMPLTRLIVRHYEHLNDARQTVREILQKPESLLFIFDGLDEYKHNLDFTQRRLCSNPEDYFPIHILVTSLVSRTLLKGCSVLITSRPTTLEPLDMDRVDRHTEILGFFPEQRLMYFKKFFGDANLGMEAFQYVEENAILYTLCFNPSYCWIICSLLKSHFSTPKEEHKAAPRTVTELFVMFLYHILTNHKREADDKRGILVKLGKMAYYGVANRFLVFYEKQEMFTFGLQPVLQSAFLSGFLKEILQRESTHECTTYTFFHLILQEFIAACSFFLDSCGNIDELLRRLDSCEDCRFETFTQFLAGFARPTVFKALEGILGELERKPAVRVLDWVKQKAERALRGEDKTKALQVLQWLFETQNKKLIQDSIGKDLNLNLSTINVSPLDCAVLGSVISCCGELEVLNLSYIHLSPECIKKLMSGLICCRCMKLQSCGLTSECCEALFLVLCAERSHLTELLLGNNQLEDSGVRLLCEGLRNRNCHLQKLSLASCNLTARCCEALSKTLCAKHSPLTELELGNVKLGDSGVHLLCKGLRNPNCKLEKLRLWSCALTSGCCEALSLALCAHHSHLTELELGNNLLNDSGVILLAEGLRNTNCKLEKLKLDSCDLTSRCCVALSSAICAEHSNLTELSLRINNLGDSGVRLLYKALRSTNCKLEKSQAK